MSKIPAINPLLQAWLLEGPLSAQVPAYVDRLRRGRYATHTSGRCLNGVAHFAHWMSMCHLPVHLLDEGCIDQFLRYHLPRCDCLGGALRTPTELHAALMPVLDILRGQGVIARAPVPTGPIADELSRYDAHMSSARGLAAGTRRGRLRIVERLLLSKFARRPVVVNSLLPEDVRQFIVDQLQALGTTSNAITMASTLRAYLRHERPKTSDTAVFVRRLAPHDEPIGVDAIRRIVRDAFRRVGIQHGRGHALRHTVACRIVNQGGSIKEVADVLRHRSLNTSMIYAKVDHGALSGVALPWPGSAA